MLSKLAKRNAKRSMRDYLVYMLTMVLITALIFAFNSMIFSKSVRTLCANAPVMIIMLSMASVFVVCITAWLVNYMVRFMADKRSREFATYLLLGFRKKQIANLFMKENMLIGLGAFFIGLAPGLFQQQVMTTLIYAIVAREYTLRLEINLWTFLLTAGIYLVCYLLALVRNRRRFKKMNIREMMYADRQNEMLKNGNRSRKQWMFFAGLGYILVFLWMMYHGQITAVNVYIALGILIVAVYFLYMGLSAFLIGYIKRGGSHLFRKGNLFVYRQLASKVRTMQRTLGTLTVLFTIVLVGCSCALMLNQFQDTQAHEKWPFDVAVYREDANADFAQEIQILKDSTDLQKAYVYRIYENGSSRMNRYMRANVSMAYEEAYFQYDTYMKLSDYNELREMLGYEPVSLDEQGYLIHTKERLKDTVEPFGELPLDLGGEKLSCEGIYTEPFEQSGHNGADYMLIVPDRDVQQMKPYYSMLAAKVQGSVPDDLQTRLLALQGIDAAGFDAEYPEYADRGVGSDTIYSDDSPVYVRENSTQDMRFLISAIIFPLFYIGLVFVCVAMTILAVQQISDSGKYRFRYSVLRKLGLKEKEIHQVILKQLLVYYICPFLVSVLISFGIVWYISKNFIYYSGVHAAAGSYFGWSVLFLGIIYIIYFCITYEEFKRNALGASR